MICVYICGSVGCCICQGGEGNQCLCLRLELLLSLGVRLQAEKVIWRRGSVLICKLICTQVGPWFRICFEAK